jgi:hypothetical protein
MSTKQRSYARSQRLAQRQEAHGPSSARQSRPAPQEDEALRLLGLVLQRGAGVPQNAGPVSPMEHPSMTPALARALGNRRFGQLAGQGPSPQHRPAQAAGPVRAQLGAQPRSALVRQAADTEAALARAPRSDVLRDDDEQETPITVNLSFQEQDMQPYQVSGATLEDVCEVLPDVLGEFHYNIPQWTWDPAPGTRRQVGTVTLPVHYNYVMPEWTELASQPPEIQAAWNSFYGDLFEHEQEHHAVCVRHFEELRDTLQALPIADRTGARVTSEIDGSTEAQNEVHRNHTGFVTPSTFVCSDYIPEQETAPEATEEPEAETETE